MQHDFVSSLQDLVDSEISQNSFNWIIFEVAVTSVELEGLINDVETVLGGVPLGHGTVHGVVWIIIFNAVCSVSYHQSACLKLNGHFTEGKLNILEVS